MQTKTNYTFATSGTGMWGCERGRKITNEGFTVTYVDAEEAASWDVAEGSVAHVSVKHNSTWDVYTDDGFTKAARAVTGIADLCFTEQGMQEDGLASMEQNKKRLTLQRKCAIVYV